MKTINDLQPSPKDIENPQYDYQPKLTDKLDNLDTDFNQDIINEIVLWKVNRYSEIPEDTLKLINQIKKTDTQINYELTGEILLKLLSKEQKGIRLPLASTILRFKNPNIYPILDQRVYRFIYGEELKYSLSNINQQIEIYLNYIDKLRSICNEFNIEFSIADRILYSMDKTYNFDVKLNGY